MQDSRNPVTNPQEKVALFRHQVVATVLAREARGEVRSEAVATVAAAIHVGPDGRPCRISVRSIYRWLKRYRERGMEGLVPGKRQGPSRVLDEKLLAYLRDQKEADPAASIPELIARARVRGLIDQAATICRTTVYRALRRSGIATTRGKTGKRALARRFSFHNRMEMVLCDGKYFRAGPKRSRRVAIFFLDDATRMVLSAVVGPSESSGLFLRGLYRCIFRFGLMQRLFSDHGSAFICHASHRVAVNLGIHLIHGTVGYPEGRGKVERFHRTAWDALLRHWDGNPEVNPSCQSLELRLDHYVNQIYNRRPHSSLGYESPLSRFGQDPKPLCLPKNHEHLFESFVLDYRRTVSRDHVVRLEGETFEVPAGYAGRPVIFNRHVFTGEVTMIHQHRRIRLQELDANTNAYRPPASTPTAPASESNRPHVPGHAQTRFDEDFPPLIDDAGNHYDEKENSND